MGNTSEIYRKYGLITKDEIKKTLDDINSELFDNKLPIFINNTDIMFINEDSDLVWWIENKPHISYYYNDESDTSANYEDANNFIEYRDVPRLRMSCWLQDVLTKEFSNRLNLINFCPGIGEEMSSSYAKNFEDYGRMYYDSLTGIKGFIMNLHQRRLYKNDLKIVKEIYPKELYDYLFDKKFKLK